MKTRIIIASVLFLVSCNKSKSDEYCQCRQEHYEVQAVNNNGTIETQNVHTYDTDYSKDFCENDGKQIYEGSNNSQWYVIKCK